MNNSTFENRLKRIISLAGSADKLADSAGMSPSLIGKYLSGKTDPTRKKLIALAKAAGVNVQWLATGEGLMRNGEWKQFSISKIELITDILEDYKKELGEKFTPEKKTEIITKLYESLIDWDKSNLE